jgi:hypothetical protein
LVSPAIDLAPTATLSEDLKFYRLDAGADVSDLLKSIQEILQEGDAHNLSNFSLQSWQWQYRNLPSHSARVYVCEHEGRIVGYYHVPVYDAYIHGEKKKFAMVQDVAVSNSMRGQGVFRRLADFVTQDLAASELDLIYTFPNKKSIHTFEKYNAYHRVGSLRAYILPIRSKLILRAKFKLFGLESIIGWFADWMVGLMTASINKQYSFLSHQSFNTELVSLFQRFSSRFSFSLNRDQGYLSWRSLQKPTGNHFIFSVSNAGQTRACGVFKKDNILGAPSLVLLDFAFDSERDLHVLLSWIRQNSTQLFSDDLAMIFTAFECVEFSKLSRYGFIPIPERFNPRPLNLLVRGLRYQNQEAFLAKKWLVTLADWDVL